MSLLVRYQLEFSCYEVRIVRQGLRDSNHSREGQLLNSDCASLPHGCEIHETDRDLHYRLIRSSTLVEQLYSVRYDRNRRLCRSIPFSTGSRRRLASWGFDSSRGEVQAARKWPSIPDSFIQPNLSAGFAKSTDMLFVTLPFVSMSALPSSRRPKALHHACPPLRGIRLRRLGPRVRRHLQPVSLAEFLSAYPTACGQYH